MPLGKTYKWCPHGCGKTVEKEMGTLQIMKCGKCGAEWLGTKSYERENEH